MSFVNTVNGRVLTMTAECVNLTPTPPPPAAVPLVYPNSASLGAAMQSSIPKVFIQGAPVVLSSAVIPSSLGDQAGVRGGIVSGEVGSEARLCTVVAKFSVGGELLTPNTCAYTHNAGNALGAQLAPTQFIVQSA